MLEGSVLSKEDVKRLVACHTEEASGFLYELYRFLEDWFSDSPYLTVKTSGSTGTPKLLKVRKEQMMQSARLTCEFLGLRQGDSVLLCMPLQYIAGKMVVVRALVAGLNLVIRTPSGHPMADVDIPLRFAAMVPLQVYNTLQVSAEKERLCRTDILIIGGGAIDAGLEAEIRQLPVKVYSTYGMTETLSHIALRRLNGPDASMLYRPFPSVRLSLSSEHTLVINTGGIKVQAEQIEEILRPWMRVPFAITSVPDARLGEAVVLLVEKGANAELPETKMKELLSKYQLPKMILSVGAIPLTETGKINRAACRQLALTYRTDR